jgi:hypothetical protein
MTRLTSVAGAAALALAVGGCAQMQSMMPGSGWTTLLDGAKGLENFNRVGEANWRAVDGVLQADHRTSKTPAYLVTKNNYSDFQIRVEFWASDDANSGIFMRCANPQEITDKSCYEANIFDRRPDPTYGTGAVVHIAPVKPMPKAGGKWNVYDITLKGSRLTLVLNGQKTVDIEHSQFKSGPIALQYGAGVVRFRKVELRPL